jgi:hypothetical protein
MASTLTPNEFKELYQAWSSEHLIDILASEKEKYQREAVYAAEQVLQERGIDYRSVTTSHNQRDIQTEVKERIAMGEHIESIRLDLKDRGLNAADLLPGMADEGNLLHGGQKEKRKKVWQLLLVFFILIRVAMILHRLSHE